MEKILGILIIPQSALLFTVNAIKNLQFVMICEHKKKNHFQSHNLINKKNKRDAAFKKYLTLTAIKKKLAVEGFWRWVFWKSWLAF
jgi:hypothetical protein